MLVSPTRVLLTVDDKYSRKESVLMKRSKSIYASVSIAALYFADKIYQAVLWLEYSVKF
jgi:hypothetical protein